MAFTAGTDQSCEAGSLTNVTGAYYGGYVTEAVLTKALERQYESLIIAGYFDPASSNPYRAIGWDQVNTPYAQGLARKAATESITLLKNDGTLPYQFANGTDCKVAMIGMWANGTTQMQGGYSGKAPYLHSPIYAAGQMGIDYIYANGPINQSTLTSNYSDTAMSAAQQADVILYFGGIDISVEAESQDRYQIGWPASQLTLIDDLAALGKPFIVIQMGTMLDDAPLLANDNVSAILWAGYPGQDGGVAALDVLTGSVAPSGRLPLTMYPADYVNEVPMTNMSLRPGTDNPGRTYKWFDNATLPFGTGMHYTDFTAAFANGSSSAPAPYSYYGGSGPFSLSAGGSYNIQSLLSSCTAAHPDLCPFPSVSVSVSNTGKTTSDFVALAFVNTTAGPTPYPLKSLAAYSRFYSIAGGATQTASLNLTLAVLARRDDMGNSILYPGDYEMLLDVPTQATLAFSLTGSQATLESWPQPPSNESYNYAVEVCPLYGNCTGQPILNKREARSLQ